MKTLHLYLLRQVLATLLMTVAVFTFVLLAGNALREILNLLVSGQASPGLVASALGYLIPWVWAFALPMGMLTSTLLVFGRFSADQELTAARASGISLVVLATPVLLLSLVLCGVSAWVNMSLAPRSRVAYKALFNELEKDFFGAQLPEGRFVKEFNNYIFYVGKNRPRASDGARELEQVMVFMLEGMTNVTTTVSAPRGLLELDPVKKEINLTLYEGNSVTFTEGSGVPVPFGEAKIPLSFARERGTDDKPGLSDMTWRQLRAELAELEARLQLSSAAAGTNAQQLTARREELRQSRLDVTSPIRVQIHRQVAFSFACFGFTLIGIPLGIRVHRRETNVGFAIALGLVVVYYSFILVAQALDTRGEWAPHLIVWLPNFIFQAVGAVLLWRANRGG